MLPSLPEVAVRVRTLTADPECTIQQLEQEIAKDAVMAARLVKVANSAALLRGQPLTSLRQAITNLGINLVRSLVTQLGILQSMQGRSDSPHMRDLDRKRRRLNSSRVTSAYGTCCWNQK